MKIKLVIAVIWIFIILIPAVLAGTVTRSFSSTTVDQNEQIVISLIVDVDETIPEQFYAVDDIYPSGWTIIDEGLLDIQESGHAKGANVTMPQESTDPVPDITYTYTIQSPSSTGTYTWSGNYMFEGMSSEQNIGGQTQVTVSSGCVPVTEVCDGIDNSCDTNIDEGCDDDGDGYCDAGMTIMVGYDLSSTCPNTDTSNTLSIQYTDDCNDNNIDVNPDATEVCDGIDNDCDDRTDYFSSPGDMLRSCGPQNETGVCSFGTESCSAGSWGACLGAVYGSQEVCDQEDDDCNGIIDDVNGGNSIETTYCQCYGGNTPISEEICSNGIDDDCNGQINDDCDCTKLDFFRDYDGDTFGDGVITARACAQPSGYVTNPYDCNDSDPGVNPEATEICNNIDDNCDGRIDYLETPDDLGCGTDIVIDASYYDGMTTNFSGISDASNMPGVILEKNQYGRIEFIDILSVDRSINLNPPFSVIKYNNISINTTALPYLNVSANVHLYYLDLLNPVIFRENSPCPANICNINYYTGGNISFNVTQFSVYFAKGSCSDGTLYGECSSDKPEYCLNGTMVNRADICGCPAGYVPSGTECVPEGSGDDGGGGGGGTMPSVCTPGDKIACKKDGVCEPSYQTCINGFWGSCEGPAPTTEVCDGVDNDCDGEIDEVCLCQPGDTRVCGPSNDTGACEFGVSRCVNGAWESCSGAVMPSAEFCDGIDNNCDGMIDNDCTSGECSHGEIPSEGCLCDGVRRSSGYCCNGLYFEEGCPQNLWPIMIVAGVVILILLAIYMRSPTLGGGPAAINQ